MIVQMENKIKNDESLTHDCNILYNILNPIKRAKSKKSLLANTTRMYEHL